jgi:hypothetical protein
VEQASRQNFGNLGRAEVQAGDDRNGHEHGGRKGDETYDVTERRECDGDCHPRVTRDVMVSTGSGLLFQGPSPTSD